MARWVVVIGLVALSAVLARLPGHSAHASTSVSLPPLGQPRPGDLDRTFGGTGTVVTDFGGFDSIEDLAVQRDGKIVAVGATYGPTTGNQFDVVRYAKNGALDPTFGMGGKLTTDFDGAARAVALQSDGKIVAAGVAVGGATGGDIVLVRYDAEGTLDPSFGFGGKVVTDFGSSHDAAGAIAIQPDGKLVVAGSTRPFGAYDSHPPDFALARYNANGTLDTSFGAGGKVSTGFQPGWADIGYGVALAPRGKIVVAGWGLPGGSGGPGVIDLARYNADGSLDTSFGGDGTVVSAPVTDSAAFSVVVQPDSKVVVAGYLGLVGLALVRYTASGSVDLVETAGPGVAYDLVRQPDGKFVAVGVGGVSSTSQDFIVVARFERSGRPDRSFHGGTVSTDVSAWDLGQAVALQPDGKIVVGGSTGRLSNEGVEAQDFVLARYVGDPQCKVPNVRGKRLAAAKRKIRESHCGLGRIRRARSRRVGRVIGQSPKPGAVRRAGFPVRLVLGRR